MHEHSIREMKKKFYATTAAAAKRVTSFCYSCLSYNYKSFKILDLRAKILKKNFILIRNFSVLHCLRWILNLESNQLLTDILYYTLCVDYLFIRKVKKKLIVFVIILSSKKKKFYFFFFFYIYIS